VSIGVCYAIHQLSGNTSAILSSVTAFDPTAEAVANASLPHLTTALGAFFGIQVSGNELPGSTLVQQFVLKMARVYALPSAAAVALSRSFIMMHCLGWVFLYSAAVLMWKFQPELMLPLDKQPAPAPPAPALEVNTEDADSGAFIDADSEDEGGSNDPPDLYTVPTPKAKDKARAGKR